MKVICAALESPSVPATQEPRDPIAPASGTTSFLTPCNKAIGAPASGTASLQIPSQSRLRWSHFLLLLLLLGPLCLKVAADPIADSFANPPDSARPGVYWYFMDGNLSCEGMTCDLESMKSAGLGHMVFLEVDVGVPRGSIDFLSETWQDLFAHAVREAERLGLEITLGSGPGWAGSGGPWVRAEESMQHLVASKVEVRGPGTVNITLPVPPPRRPFFGDVPNGMPLLPSGLLGPVRLTTSGR